MAYFLQKKCRLFADGILDCRKIAEYLQIKCRLFADGISDCRKIAEQVQIFCRWNFGLQKNCRKSADFAAQNALFLHFFCTVHCVFAEKVTLHCVLQKKCRFGLRAPPPRTEHCNLHFFCTSEKVQIWPPARPLQSALFLQSKIPSAKYLHFFCNPPPNPIHTFSAFSAKIIQPLSQAGCHKLTFFLPERTQTRARRSTSNALPLRYMPAKNTPGGSFFQIERDSQAHITVSTYGFVVSST